MMALCPLAAVVGVTVEFPVLEAFDWLTDEDRKKILHHNPAKVIPALAKV